MTPSELIESPDVVMMMTVNFWQCAKDRDLSRRLCASFIVLMQRKHTIERPVEFGSHCSCPCIS